MIFSVSTISEPDALASRQLSRPLPELPAKSCQPLANENCASNFASRSLVPELERTWLVRQSEVHQDLRLDLHGLAVQIVRLVLPLLHSILGSFGQNCVAADDLQIRNVAVFGDRRLQLY